MSIQIGKRDWSTWSQFFASSGAILIFVSWVLQNYFQQESQAKIRHLELSQQLIMMEELNQNQWLTLYTTERLSQSPRTEIINVSALQSYLHALNLLTWSAGRLEEDAEKASELIQKKRDLTSRAQQLFIENNTSELTASLNSIVQMGNALGPTLIDNANQAFQTARERETHVSRLFLLSYILGSGAIAIGFSLTKITSRKNIATSRDARGR